VSRGVVEEPDGNSVIGVLVRIGVLLCIGHTSRGEKKGV